jgi:type I restriction enzyme, S subunit
MSMVQLGELMATQTPGLNPAQFQDEEFELWSIPAFDAGAPERLLGSEIGSAKKVIQPGDVLLSRIVPHIRRSWVVSESADGLRQIGSGEWIIFRSKRCDPNYLRHFLISDVFHPQFMQTVAGVGGSLLRARPEGVKEISFYLPPLEEQKRIAAILDQADELRRKRQRALDRLNRLGQAFFIEMFGDPVANPFDFPVRKLGELGDLDRGISKHRPRNDPALLNGDHPLIQTGDVANADGYIRDFSSTYSDLGLRQSRKWPVGTLCITIAANIGKTGILEIEACFPDSVVGFTPGSSTNAEYVQHWMERIQKRLEEVAPQSAQKNINLAILRELPIPVPPIEKQGAFASRIKTIEAQKLKLKISAVQFDQLFSSLQHRTFRGGLTASSLKEAAA